MRHLDQVNLKARERDAIRQATALLKSQFDIARIILFGSKARGDDRLDSDIDLLVLTNTPASQAEKAEIVGALFDLELELNVVLSVMVVGIDEWERGSLQALPIHARIQEEGVLT